ncbi:hypothetical protein BKA65DRAFT_212475 [Rhexocercosporidium sp. MPI-PUGE-AT-0058]|nr:hypothetical protein BKA65DRAFT_212475 [Rhexocercosporidium sp. MPI-PUGE-AT-0058]
MWFLFGCMRIKDSDIGSYLSNRTCSTSNHKLGPTRRQRNSSSTTSNLNCAPSSPRELGVNIHLHDDANDLKSAHAVATPTPAPATESQDVVEGEGTDEAIRRSTEAFPSFHSSVVGDSDVLNADADTDARFYDADSVEIRVMPINPYLLEAQDRAEAEAGAKTTPISAVDTTEEISPCSGGIESDLRRCNLTQSSEDEVGLSSSPPLTTTS